MASFFRVGGNLLSSISQTFQDIRSEESQLSSYPNDLNYILHGTRGILVFHLQQSPSTSHSSSSSSSSVALGKKILHLNYKDNVMILYNDPSTTVASSSSPSASSPQQQWCYSCEKFSSIKRISSLSIQIEMSSMRQSPLVLTFRNEPNSNQFLKFLLSLFFYGKIISKSFRELIQGRAPHPSASAASSSFSSFEEVYLTKSDLLEAFQSNDLTSVTSEHIDTLFNLLPPSSPSSSSSSDQSLDYINFFELLLDLPVFNAYDCLTGLLSRIGLCDASVIPYQDPLLAGEVIVKHIPYLRWFICANDLDINSPSLDSTDRITWFGSLIFTNYRLILYSHQKNISLSSKFSLLVPKFFNKLSIPLNSISKVLISSEPVSLTQLTRLHLLTKDYKLLRFIFFKDFTFVQAMVFFRQLLNGIFIVSTQRMFCYHYQQQFTDTSTTINGWQYSDIRYDYHRMGLMNDSEWSVIENIRGEIIETYPSYLIVPSSLSREMIQRCVSFRSLGRFPVVTYRHEATQCCLTRSGQPLMSQSNAYGSADRELLDAYRTSGVFNQHR
jgi:hypothetical protein